MRKLVLATLLLSTIALPAKADVIISDSLSGTGDNVTFQSLNGSTAIGSFNGQNQGLVDFTDLSGNTGFTGSANGNDIKIANTSDLQVVVFANDNTTVLPTSTQVFSLKGTGDVIATVQATDGTFTFDLGQINPNAQSGFTLTAINGEVMTSLILADTGGVISDYEHYRIDVAATSAVPEPATWAMMLIGFLGVGLFGLRKRRTTFRFA